jgi:hypothetical protein
MGFFFLLVLIMKCIESRRITKLLEGEVEQDEVFWNQDALKDVGAVFPYDLLGFSPSICTFSS